MVCMWVCLTLPKKWVDTPRTTWTWTILAVAVVVECIALLQPNNNHRFISLHLLTLISLLNLGCCSCCCSPFRARYKRLVDNIFPTNYEDGLVKSNMEKLIFYALSSPEKLDRIGSYLEERISRDLSRHRIGYFNFLWFIFEIWLTHFFTFCFYLVLLKSLSKQWTNCCYLAIH